MNVGDLFEMPVGNRNNHRGSPAVGDVVVMHRTMRREVNNEILSEDDFYDYFWISGDGGEDGPTIIGARSNRSSVPTNPEWLDYMDNWMWNEWVNNSFQDGDVEYIFYASYRIYRVR